MNDQRKVPAFSLDSSPDLRLNTEIYVDLELEKKWKEKLYSNDPFPLAPKDLKRLGLINKENFEKENNRWRREVAKILSDEAFNIFKELPPAHYFWEFWGWGKGREAEALKLIAHSTSAEKFRIRDNLSEACKNAEEQTRDVSKEVDIQHGEILNAWEQNRIDPQETLVITASQFIQDQEKEALEKHMGKLADFVKTPVKDVKGLEHIVYLIHATRKHNSGKKKWGDLVLDGVEWGDTIPHDIAELEEVAPGTKITEIKTFPYYHQTYSILKMVKDRPK